MKRDLKKEYEAICNEYIKDFVKKQGYEFSYWVADKVGGIACFIEQYFFNIDDIRYDIDNKVKKGRIFEWQDFCIENSENECERNVNFESYLLME